MLGLVPTATEFTFQISKSSRENLHAWTFCNIIKGSACKELFFLNGKTCSNKMNLLQNISCTTNEIRYNLIAL